MSFNIPNTFVAGTKAKADEVNENFSSVKEEIIKGSQNLALIKEDLNEKYIYWVLDIFHLIAKAYKKELHLCFFQDIFF